MYLNIIWLRGVPLCQTMRVVYLLVLAGFLAITGLAFLIAGIVLLSKGDASCSEGSSNTSNRKSLNSAPGRKSLNLTERCSYSEEAITKGLDKFLQKVQDSYYKLHPNKISSKPKVSSAEIQAKYRSYDPSPQNIKIITDKALALLDEINAIIFESHKLKPRERKALAQVKHYLQHIFGTPYDVNYYAGDFLLGPNLWCWQPLCDTRSEMKNSLYHFKPNSTEDLENLLKKFGEIKETFVQYRKNMEYGVLVGMVRSVEQCKAGINGLTSYFREISIKGAKGVLEEDFVKRLLQYEFLEVLTNNSEEISTWEKKNGKSVNQSLRDSLVENIGKPIEDFFTYLRKDHMQHCVSSNVSSGLATLPLSYVYVNNTADKSRPANGSLPTGERLSGNDSYKLLVSYFTTNTMSPKEINDLGFKMLKELYPQVLEVARLVTQQTDNDTAKEEFRKKLKSRVSELNYLEGEFPKNESDENAHVLCGNVEGAKKYCPTRWRALQNWFDEAHMALGLLDPKTINMFHFNGAKHTTPNCPIQLSPDFNPSGGANYNRAGKDCKKNARYNIPFFTSEPANRYEEWSINAHEGRPGHHTQVQGLEEHFRDRCGGVIKWLDQETYYTAFTEGWGLYAENPLIGEDTDVYKDEPLQKYGMLKWQVWRALRLIVDSGLHYQGFSRQKALDFFADFAWDESGEALREVTRYQSAPGQATAYMIGQQHIKKLREYAKEMLGDKFKLRDFHYHLLSQGSAPLSYLEQSIETYVKCVKNENASGCYEILNPAVNDPAADVDDDVGDDLYEPIRGRHYF